MTAEVLYVRLHGPLDVPYRGRYDAQTLLGWASALSTWYRRGLDVYCYFDNDEAKYAPQSARALQDMLT